MQIGFDARMMIGEWRHRGIGNYTNSILKYSPYEIVAFLPRKQKIDNFSFNSKGIDFYPWWEQFVLPRMVKNKKINYLLCPGNTSPIFQIKGTKTIVVIHDLIFMKSFDSLPISRNFKQNFGRLYRRFLIPKSCKVADNIITVSNYTRQELINRFALNPNKIHIIPNSIDDSWFVKSPVNDVDRSSYLIAVTGDSPSKNVPRLLEAFSILNKIKEVNDFKLHIVGIKPASFSFYQKLVIQLGIANNVIFEKYLNKDQLQLLYRKAWASITFSLYEGFGIPIIEAMASGTPVVCSNTTSMPEVAGDAAIYADPWNVQSMAVAMHKIIKASSKERTKMSNMGLSRAALFSEAIVAKRVKKIWSEIL